jgi:alcohol dehydrogenase (cytochrome c)
VDSACSATACFIATLDAHIVALDRATGKELWDTTLADFKQGHAATLAPLVVREQSDRRKFRR